MADEVPAGQGDHQTANSPPWTPRQARSLHQNHGEVLECQCDEGQDHEGRPKKIKLFLKCKKKKRAVKKKDDLNEPADFFYTRAVC